MSPLDMTLQLLAASTPALPPAGTTPGAPRPPGQDLFNIIFSFGPLILLMILFFWMVSGAKRKEERTRKAMMSALKKGDRIRMIGGELGSIVDIAEKTVLVKVDESSNTKIRYVKEAIASVLSERDEKPDSK